ncbi:MAG TPA: family 16 glycosylhydrolase [Candidatus Paceibacterota bacterium]
MEFLGKLGATLLLVVSSLWSGTLVLLHLETPQNTGIASTSVYELGDDRYTKTDEHVFYNGQVLLVGYADEPDPESFEYVGGNGRYFKDKNYVYNTTWQYASRIEGADPATFALVDNNILYDARDKDHTYLRGGVVQGEKAPTAPVQTSVKIETPVDYPKASSVSSVSGVITRTLDVGSSGTDVAVLQNFLKTKGYYASEITGYFGPATGQAVAALQSANDLEPVGAVGPRTLTLVNTLMGFKKSSVAVNETKTTPPPVAPVAKGPAPVEPGVSKVEVPKPPQSPPPVQEQIVPVSTVETVPIPIVETGHSTTADTGSAPTQEQTTTGIATSIPPPFPGYTLLFQDEFNQPKIYTKGSNNPWTTTWWFGNDISGRNDTSLFTRNLYIDANFKLNSYTIPNIQAGAPAYKLAVGSGLAPNINPFIFNNGVLSIRADRMPPALLQDLAVATMQTWKKDPTGTYPGSDGNKYSIRTFPLQYTSGLLTTYNSFNFTYGYVEARIKIPKGVGFWPAFWMLKTVRDPTIRGEIDIMEAPQNIARSLNERRLNATFHYDEVDPATGAHKDAHNKTVRKDTGTDLSLDFHTYSVNWNSQTITFYLDGVVMGSAPTPAGLKQPMFLLLNFAVGGESWSGPVNSTTPFPSDMQIDYVRVWQGSGGTGQPSNTNTTNVSDTTTTSPPTTTPAPPTGSTGGVSCTTATSTDAVTTDCASYVLSGGSGLLYLTYNGSSDFKGTGNALNNVILGGAGSDTLSGGGGNDTLDGRGGADKLSGNSGADTFIINSTNASVIVTDFVPGSDKVNVAAMGLHTFAEVTAAVTQAGPPANIKSGGITLALTGVAASALSAGDFVFTLAQTPGQHQLAKAYSNSLLAAIGSLGDILAWIWEMLTSWFR